MQIENTILSVKARTLGAELVSIFDKRDNTEHLWQADPNFWAAHAPVLFPIVGRCYNDSITIKGEKYNMDKHGFARRNAFQLTAQQVESMTFELCSNEQLKKTYPFDFSFKISYTLAENSLTTTYEIENRSATEMPFALGAHPAFSVPFFKSESYEDYAIEFQNDFSFSRHHINNDGFFDGRISPVASNFNSIPLKRNLFTDDALIFKDLKSRAVSIVSTKHNKKLKVNFEGFPYLGVWAKTGADYVCIEPWIGCADADKFTGEFIQKENVIVLAAGKVFKVSFSISII